MTYFIDDFIRWALGFLVKWFGIPVPTPVYSLPKEAYAYLFSTFVAKDSKFYLLASDNLVDWVTINSEYGVQLHDPSLTYVNDTYYIAYTGGTQSFGLASSKDLKTWTTVKNIPSFPNANNTWAPEFYIEDDGQIHVFFCANFEPVTNAGFKIYETHPIGDMAGPWSTPVQVTGAGLPSNIIDPFVVKIDGSYYLWYVNGTEGKSGGMIEYAVSDSLTSGYKVVKSGNWTGWGTRGIDGPALVRTGPTNWMIFIESSKYSTQLRCAVSNDNFETVSELLPINAAIQAQHGTIIPTTPKIVQDIKNVGK